MTLRLSFLAMTRFVASLVCVFGATGCTGQEAVPPPPLTVQETVAIATERLIDGDKGELEAVRRRANPEALPRLLDMLDEEKQRENWGAILQVVKYIATSDIVPRSKEKLKGFLGEVDIYEYDYILGYVDALAYSVATKDDDKMKSAFDEVLKGTHWQGLKFQLAGTDRWPEGQPSRETFLSARAILSLKNYGGDWKAKRAIAAAAIAEPQQAKIFDAMVKRLCGE